jgi:hypothetical protein
VRGACTETAAGTGAGAGGHIGRLTGAGVVSLVSCTVRVSTGRSATTATTTMPARSMQLNMVGRSQRFAMYIELSASLSEMPAAD